MKYVSDILSESSLPIQTVNPAHSVFEALQLLSQNDTGALLVMDGDRVVGLFSERDYTRRVELAGRSSKTTTVAEVMTRDVISVSLETSAERCLQVMHEHHIRHLPVISRQGQIVGFISILDVVQSVLGEKQEIISSFENYVASQWPF